MRPAHRAAGIRALVAAGTAVLLIGVAPTLVEASTADRLDQTRAAIERAAVEYFDAQQEAADIERELAAVEERLDKSSGRIGALQAAAAERAAELYRSGGGVQMLSAYDTDNVLDVARRAALIEQANAEADESIDAFAAASADLREQREELTERREAQTAILASLEATQAELDDQLASLKEQLESERAAQRQAAAAAARAAARAQQAADDEGAGSGSTSPTTRANPGGGTSPSNPAPTTPSTAPATNPTNPTVPTTTPTTPTTTPPNTGVHPAHNDPYLSCVRHRESRGIYSAVNPAGYYGAYQFAIRTWDATAAHAGRYELVGVRPDRAGVWDQDDMAWTLLNWYGTSPWGGPCP